MLNVMTDDDAKERAERAHQMLTDPRSYKTRRAGAVPKSNKYVDLSAVVRNDLYLFEMKSTTAGNMHAQIRRAISQLYEYRFLQEMPSAKLEAIS